jgi:hypothetical protein
LHSIFDSEQEYIVKENLEMLTPLPLPQKTHARAPELRNGPNPEPRATWPPLGKKQKRKRKEKEDEKIYDNHYRHQLLGRTNIINPSRYKTKTTTTRVLRNSTQKASLQKAYAPMNQFRSC